MALELDTDRLADFARCEGIELVVLFGSRASGQEHAHSDTDIAVLPGAVRTAVARWRLEGELGLRLQRADLDVVWLDEASWLLAWEVSQGTRLYEARAGAFDRFKTEAWLRYADSEVWRHLDRVWFERFTRGDWSLNTVLLRRKLNAASQYLLDLEATRQIRQTDFVGSSQHYVAERLLQLLIDTAAAINTEVAQSVARIPPSDYYSSFFSMARTGWIDEETAAALAPLAQLRNRVVHAYQDVRLSDVYRSLQDSLPTWRTYLAAVNARLT